MRVLGISLVTPQRLATMAFGMLLLIGLAFSAEVQSADGPTLGPTFGAPDGDEASPSASDDSDVSSSEDATSQDDTDTPQPHSQDDAPATLPTKPRQAKPIQPAKEPKPISSDLIEPRALKSEVLDDSEVVIDGGDDGDALIDQAYAMTKTAKSIDQLTQIIDLLERALKASPSEGRAQYGRTLLAWAHNRRGERYAAEKRDDEALDDFATAISLDSKQWRAAHNRGVSYAMMGKYEEALEDFNRAIGLNRNYANTWYNRGEIRYERGDYEGAADDYTQAIRLAPQDPAAYNSRGHAYYRLNRIPEAMRDYDRAVQLDPQNGAILTNRGDAHAHQGNYAAAARDFREAIRVSPQLGRAYQSAAWLMATSPDPRFRNAQLGLDAAQRAIQLDGDEDFRYLDTLAAAYANAGQYEQAIETQTKAIEVMKDAEEGSGEALIERLALYQASKPFRENDGVSLRPIGPQDARSRSPQRSVTRQPLRQPRTQQQPIRQQPSRQPQTTRTLPRRQYRTQPSSAGQQR